MGRENIATQTASAYHEGIEQYNSKLRMGTWSVGISFIQRQNVKFCNFLVLYPSKVIGTTPFFFFHLKNITGQDE